MADIDQTNIYSYCGNNFMLDFKKYLHDHGITIDEIELMNGTIAIWLPNEKNPIKFPQYAQWLDIASKLKGGGK